VGFNILLSIPLPSCSTVNTKLSYLRHNELPRGVFDFIVLTKFCLKDILFKAVEILKRKVVVFRTIHALNKQHTFYELTYLRAFTSQTKVLCFTFVYIRTQSALLTMSMAFSAQETLKRYMSRKTMGVMQP